MQFPSMKLMVSLVTWHHRNHLKLTISGSNMLAADYDASVMDIAAKNLQVLIWSCVSHKLEFNGTHGT